MTANHDRYWEDPRYPTPGVYFEEIAPKKVPELRTGVPAFLGFSQPTDLTRRLETGRFLHPYALTAWTRFAALVGKAAPGGFLDHAVRGFFANGGETCVVIPLPLRQDWLDREPAEQSQWVTDKVKQGLELLELETLERNKDLELKALELMESVDLICAPDLSLALRPALQKLARQKKEGTQVEELESMVESMIGAQRSILKHCWEMKNRFAILDSIPTTNSDLPSGKPPLQKEIYAMLKHWHALVPGKVALTQGALYCPWVRPTWTRDFVPPCGHVAGIYARVDSRIGVHKAPANEIVEGTVDLERQVNDQDQRILNSVGVNCLRAFPGRGIRVWGARTLSPWPQWRYVNVMRLFITLVRWIDHTSRDLVFEPNTPALWEPIRGRLNNYCYDLFQKGALKGQTPAEAFFVKCDAETNPPEKRETGEVISEVGLAPVMTAEFIVVRITHSAAGSTFTGP